MNVLNFRAPTDALLHLGVMAHLRDKPDTYMNLWEFYKDSEGALFVLLQRMLDEGEITADNLKDGLITDQSVIQLKIPHTKN